MGKFIAIAFLSLLLMETGLVVFYSFDGGAFAVSRLLPESPEHLMIILVFAAAIGYAIRLSSQLRYRYGFGSQSSFYASWVLGALLVGSVFIVIRYLMMDDPTLEDISYASTRPFIMMYLVVSLGAAVVGLLVDFSQKAGESGKKGGASILARIIKAYREFCAKHTFLLSTKNA